MMQRYGPAFARVYNEYWNGFSLNFAPVIHGWLGEAGPRRLLDLCCGTGQLCKYFLDAGWQVTGLDLSLDMLKMAEENNADYLRSSRFSAIQANAGFFRLDASFGVVTSIFDALNHLEGEAELASCFACVHAVLVEGGRFVFDLNTRRGLRGWNDLTIRDEDSLFLVNRGMFVEETGKAFLQVTGFSRAASGAWERFGETMFNTCFPIERVVGLLKSAGFGSIGFRKADRSFAPVDDPEAENRVFLVAKKDRSAMERT
jgi:SAM-dependent methyltransferase